MQTQIKTNTFQLNISYSIYVLCYKEKELNFQFFTFLSKRPSSEAIETEQGR